MVQVHSLKNKYIGSVIPILEKKLKKKIFWNFFATAHGKGCVDGIGATVKNRVKRLILARKAVINCAKDFVTAFNAKGENSKVKLLEMTGGDIVNINKTLKLTEVFDKAQTIKSIASYHQLQTINDCVSGFTTSNEGYYSNENLSVQRIQTNECSKTRPFKKK